MVSEGGAGGAAIDSGSVPRIVCGSAGDVNWRHVVGFHTPNQRRALVVLVTRDSEFGLLRAIEERRQILGEFWAGLLGASPQTPGIYRFWPSTVSAECVGWL
jgi:hypothetical protein